MRPDEISEFNPPPLDKLPGNYHACERGLDPWHADAFPDEFKHFGKGGARAKGWFLLDAWGNAIGFIPDGTIIS
jgi:hypothetical protein